MDDAIEPKTDSRPAKVIERITIGKEEADKLSAWLRQLEGSSQFLQLSRSDIANFLIREHKVEFSPREIQRIRTQHYDPVKHLNWITPRLKEALQNKNMAMVAELQAQIRSIELADGVRAPRSEESAADQPKKPRRARDKRNEPTGRSLAELQSDLPEG